MLKWILVYDISSKLGCKMFCVIQTCNKQSFSKTQYIWTFPGLIQSDFENIIRYIQTIYLWESPSSLMLKKKAIWCNVIEDD